ncbi:hypothetical protein E0F15_16950 [Frankia sp. B2]|nr:hypothetical protein E0F15_16950 [Frankia sp. B2]
MSVSRRLLGWALYPTSPSGAIHRSQDLPGEVVAGGWRREGGDRGYHATVMTSHEERIFRSCSGARRAMNPEGRGPAKPVRVGAGSGTPAWPAGDGAHASRLETVASWAAVFTIVMAAVTLLGWTLDNHVLTSIKPVWPSTKPNGAVCGLLLGFSLWSRLGRRRTAVRAAGQGAAALALAISGLSLVESAVDRNFGIDELLFIDQATASQSHPGRIVPFGAAILALLSLALLLFDTRRWRGRYVAQALVCVAGFISFTVLLSYLYGVDFTSGYTRVAVPAAVATLVLSVGATLARLGYTPLAILASSGAGGGVARQLLPATVIVPVLVGTTAVALWRLGFYGVAFRGALVVSYTVVMLLAVTVGICRRLDHADAERLRVSADLAAANERLAGTNARLAEANTRLVEANKRMHEAIDELGSFTYSVSHDLRAPLRSMSGFSRILMDEYAEDMPEQARGYLDRVQRSSDRMGALIDDLLAFSRLGRQPMSKREVDPAAIVSAVLAEQEGDRAGRPVRITVGDLPRGVADPVLLKVVYTNLLSNAVKFTRGRDPARIEIGSRRENGRVVFYVADNGAGFDPRYADKLFGVFQRLHRSEQFEGTGVGLALCQRVIARHGGRIWAEAAQGKGATFFFTLSEEVSA